MAYASLAEVDPIYGIYTAIFPVLIYAIFGPSRHISFGTNPLTSILIGLAVTNNVNPLAKDVCFGDDESVNGTMVNGTIVNDVDEEGKEFCQLEVITTLALMTGLWQVIIHSYKL